MTGSPLAQGDVLDVTITKELPFGVLVEAPDGVPGLVRGSAGEVGSRLRVEVIDHDAAEHRFSARLA